MPEDELLLNRLSTISALYNRIDSCIENPGLELSQFLRELGFQAAQAADYVDQKIATSPRVSETPHSSTFPRAHPTTHPTTAPIAAPPANLPVAAAPPAARIRKEKLASADIAQQRYTAILTHIPDKIDPFQVKEYLSKTHDQSHNSRTHAQFEDEAFRRLLRGYEPGCDEIWENLFHSVTEQHYNDIYMQSQANDALPLAESLHKRDLFLHNCHFNQTIDRYVTFILRSIEIIKFTKHWNNLDNLPNGRSIKKQHLLQLFKSLHTNLFEDLAVAENTLNVEIEQRGELVDLYRQNVEQEQSMVKDSLRVFKGKHCRVITARNTLLSLYTKFGNAVLLDPIWDAASQNTASGLPGRSDSFRALVSLFCKGEPTIDPDAEEAFQNITSALGISGVVDV